MKLNYVSVLREYRSNNREGGYYVRGELESQPTNVWFKEFQWIWMHTPATLKLSSSPQLNRNDILIPLADEKNISAAVEALKNIVSLVKEPIIDMTDSPYTQVLN